MADEIRVYDWIAKEKGLYPAFVYGVIESYELNGMRPEPIKKMREHAQMNIVTFWYHLQRLKAMGLVKKLEDGTLATVDIKEYMD